MNQLLHNARNASKKLLALSDIEINDVILALADALKRDIGPILAANALDLSRMDPSDPKYDRLKLTPDRIIAMATDMQAVASLPSPLREIDSDVRPNGLRVRRVAVPFGVVGIIYEARPNVTTDVAALCLKSANACVLKGGRDADESCRAIVAALRPVLEARGIADAVTLLPATHQASAELMAARGLVDVIIPRGSKALIESVRASSQVPVIETGAGVCHCYVDAAADAAMASRIIHNAKTRRVSVCNALDCTLVHADIAACLPELCAPLAACDVIIRADERAFAALSGRYPDALLKEAHEEDFGREFLAYEMAVRVVDTIDDALAHIDRYGSGHSESIVTQDAEAAARFRRDVDAACVYVNAPTSFTDGAQLGLGAEIGISTQKLHARGPMGLRELTTYKWLIDGDGQTRPK